MADTQMTDDVRQETLRFLSWYRGVVNSPAVRERFNESERIVLLGLGAMNRESDPWVTGQTLCQIYGFKPAYLSEIVGGLEGQGLIKKVQSEEDARANILVLTDEGKRCYRGIAQFLGSLSMHIPIDGSR
jgi:DNA-binding MarR family transcriptional regulator